MNYREDLEFQLQKVTLAIQEVVEDVYITDKVRPVSYTHLTLPTNREV